jgi:tellurite resistance protein TerC
MAWHVWAAFTAFIVVMLMLDLGIFHRKAHAVSLKEATGWVMTWISLAALFCVLIYFWQGPIKMMEFLTGYVIEYSLSVDNLFVFVMLFTYFNVPAPYQHRVLFWGILGALVMRGLFIAAGTALLAEFQWMIYVFGAFLVFTGVKMGTAKNEGIEPGKNPVVRFVRRWVPLTDYFDGQRFFTRQAAKFMATPMFLVLVAVETTDVIFAFDSVPAILGVSRDPFIVWTSNVFAILGLRSLYFVLAGIMDLFHYLKYGLAIILVFIGAKMLLSSFYHIPIQSSLGVVVAIVGLSVAASLLMPARAPERGEENTG